MTNTANAKVAKKKKPEGQQMIDSRQREIQSLMEIKRLRMQAAPWLNLAYLVVLPAALLIFGRGGKMHG